MPQSKIHKVIKFGGTSVGSAERIHSVIEIVLKYYNENPSLVVVVSAFAGVTDQLNALGRMAADANSEYRNVFQEIKERHKNALPTLVKKDKIPKILEELEVIFTELHDILEGAFLIRELSLKTLDLIMSFGERFSACIVSEALKQKIPETSLLDARELIKTDKTFGKAVVDFEASNTRILNHINKSKCVYVIPGFIASSYNNETTTLGRGGSDYTAAIVGAAVQASVIEIWTDVNGVMTADPRKEPYAFTIPEMTYKEAMEMTYFGAKVIHPPTIIPALEKKIPLLVKNSFHPEHAGTLIREEAQENGHLICGISSIENAALICLQGSGMVGVCGIAQRFFGALAQRGINIILISQGSSEHSICVGIAPSYLDEAKEAVLQEFHLEMKARLIDELVLERNLSVIALVGRNMKKNSGIAGKFFDTLGKNGINVVAIAQGSSELNISVVIKKEDESKAIRVTHEAFFLSPAKTLNVFLVGVGLIGNTLLKQMQGHLSKLKKDHALDIRIVGIANSKVMALDTHAFKIEDCKSVLAHAKDKMHIDTFVDRMLSLNLINSVFVDCTSSQDLANAYERILNASISIVTPNKKANSGTSKYYKALREALARRGAKFFYGSNAGAGLPVISTIHELVRSGDKIHKIEAILSGTMSFLFNSFGEGKTFSSLVREAQKKGYTEPDPREDLNGMDLARKLLILARESSYHLELEDLNIEKILPKEFFDPSSVDEFYKKLEGYDKVFEAHRLKAQKASKKLRYIAKFENGKGKVSLETVDVEHPFYHLKGNDNIILITSEFYKENPLIIRGPGAGSEVTAGKVFADIIRLGLDFK